MQRVERATLTALLALSAMAASATPPPDAAEWHCTAETGTAYRYDAARDRWKTVVFQVEDQSWIVRRLDGGRWEASRAGMPEPLRCAPEPAAPQMLACGPSGEFRLDRNARRFESHHFAESVDELESPTVSGHCRQRASPDVG